VRRPERQPQGIRKVVAGASCVALLCLLAANSSGSGQRAELYE
jgi:hypothetical protein